MSYPLRNQLTVWWQTIASEETFNTYQKTLLVTWQILQETAKLLWLFLCLGLVLVNWLADTSTRSGQQVKAWVDHIPEPKGEHLWQEVVEKVSTYSRSSTASIISQARRQLGLPEPPPSAPHMPPPKPTAATTPEPPIPVATVAEEPQTAIAQPEIAQSEDE